MKKLVSLCLSLMMCCCFLLPVPIRAQAAGNIEAALEWALAIADDNSHWYSQSNRNGPDYDCSSFVFYALKAGGFDVGNSAFNTRNMRGVLTGIGFQWISWSNIGNSSNLQRGDILLDESAHTEFYLGGGKCVAAANDDDGIIRENFWNNAGGVSWDGVLRYSPPAPVVPSKPTLSVSANTSASPVGFSWNACDNADWYDVYICNPDGTNIAVEYRISGLSYSYSLASGSYYANVASVNANGNYTFSDNVSFTVKEPPKQLTINYNTNGGTIAEEADYKASDDGTILVKSSGKVYATIWNNGSGSPEYGLTNASSFKLTKTGYRFLGWSLAKDSGTIFDQDDTALTANDIYPDIVNGSAKVMLYARWEQISVPGDINADSEVDETDLTLLKNWLLTAPQTTLKDAKAADLNGDGKLNAVDYSMLKRKILTERGIIIILNKYSLTLNTEGTSKTFQLICSYPFPDDVVWSSSNATVASVKAGLVTAQKDGTATITASANGTSVSCKVNVKTAYTETWSDWSDWSTTKIDASDTVQVEKEDRGSQVLVSYNMEAYCTAALNPWRRQYRNYSVNGNFDENGLSSAYGEHHNEWTFTVDEVNAATVIHPGEQQGGAQNGTNMSNVDGYSMYFAEAYYIFFIKSENYDTVYTTYYKSRHLIKIPAEYKN
ncbi:MAG: Ig-like domain-containing protein [Oscillospiraceae bacterium]|nr:Ig-like domain-containing protein [Oscillospiraceae bacterium]